MDCFLHRLISGWVDYILTGIKNRLTKVKKGEAKIKVLKY